MLWGPAAKTGIWLQNTLWGIKNTPKFIDQLEGRLSDFNNFWYNYFWYSWPSNDYLSFYLT